MMHRYTYELEGFKSIHQSDELTLSGITLLTGVNSCGKTSLMQSLLLLKQTLEDESNTDTLKLNGPYVSLGTFQNLIHNHNLESELTFKLSIPVQRSMPFVTLKFTSIDLKLSFCQVGKRTRVKEYRVTWVHESQKRITFKCEWLSGSNYRVTYDSRLFESLYSSKREELEIFETPKVRNVRLNNFYKFLPMPRPSVFSSLSHTRVLDQLRAFFDKVYYIGPLRQEPKKFYTFDEDLPLGVGKAGEATPHTLTAAFRRKVRYKLFEDDTQKYKVIEERLDKAVERWLCQEFCMADTLTVYRSKNLIYEVLLSYITGQNHNRVNIKDVGFGISQILPIIVQALLMPEDSFLLLEQPEIHLHPKAQSTMADFLLSSALVGRHIIVETHSDHLLTRIRRRVAETNGLEKDVKIYFVENSGDDHAARYIPIEVNKYGVFSLWPKDFCSDADEEYRAILVAQNRKRRLERTDHH